MLTKESYDVDSSNATNAKTIDDDDDEEEEEEEEEGGVLHDDEGIATRPRYCTKIQISRSSRKTMTKKKKKKKEKKKKKKEKKKGKKSEHNKKKMARVERLRSILSFRQVKSCWSSNSLRRCTKRFCCKEGCMFSIITYVSIRACLDIKSENAFRSKSVTMLEKAKTAGIFNNAAFYIVHQNGKREFFTSFIFPEKVFNFLEQKWKMSSDYGRLFRGHRRHESMDFDETLRLKEEQRMLAQLGDSDLSDRGKLRGEENKQHAREANLDGYAGFDSERSHEQMKSLRRRRRRSEHRESTEDNTDDLSSNTATTGDNIEENEAISEKRRATTLDPTTSKTHWDNEEEEEKEKERGTREEIANEEESDDFGEIPRMRTLPDDGKDENTR